METHHVFLHPFLATLCQISWACRGWARVWHANECVQHVASLETSWAVVSLSLVYLEAKRPIWLGIKLMVMLLPWRTSLAPSDSSSSVRFTKVILLSLELSCCSSERLKAAIFVAGAPFVVFHSAWGTGVHSPLVRKRATELLWVWLFRHFVLHRMTEWLACQ